MNRTLQFSLGVCALVALSVPADARSKQKCVEISGSGSFIFQDMAKETAKYNLNQKIETLKQKAPGKVKVKGEAKSTCSGNDCKASQKVCLQDFDGCWDPEEC